MDEDTRVILKDWSLSEYIDIFKENKIDINSLNILDHEIIKELIKPIGDRARFTQNLSLWKQISQDTDQYLGELTEKHRSSLSPLEDCATQQSC